MYLSHHDFFAVWRLEKSSFSNRWKIFNIALPRIKKTHCRKKYPTLERMMSRYIFCILIDWPYIISIICLKTAHCWSNLISSFLVFKVLIIHNFGQSKAMLACNPKSIFSLYEFWVPLQRLEEAKNRRIIAMREPEKKHNRWRIQFKIVMWPEVSTPHIF